VSFVRQTAKVGKLSSIYMTGSIVPKVIGLFLLPVFTHYLVPEQLGIARLALQIIMPLSILAQLGLGASLKSHYFRVEDGERPELVRTIFQAQATFAFIFCIVLSFTGFWFAEKILPNLPISLQKVRLLWLMIVWSCFFGSLVQLAIRMTQMQERATVCVFIALLRYLVKDILGVVGVVWLGWQGFGRFGTAFIGLAVAAFFATWVILRFVRGEFQLSLFKKVLKTGLSFLPQSIANTLSLTLNAWLVNTMISTAAVGIYAIAIQFAQFIQLPQRAFVNATYPTLAKLIKEGSQKAKQRQSRLYTLSITALGLLALAISLLAPAAIDIFVQADYHHAKGIVPILVIAWALQSFSWGSTNVIFYFGSGLLLTAATGISLMTNIVLCIILIPRFDMYGAAYAMICSFAAKFIVVTILAQKKYPVPWQIWTILRVLALFIILGFLDRWLSPGLSLWLQISVKLIILTASIPLLLLCRIVNKSELAELKDLFLEKLGY